MKLKYSYIKLLTITLLAFNYSCAAGPNISTVAPELEKEYQQQVKAKAEAPTIPKLHLKINKAEIEVPEQDLDLQLKTILAASEDKKIQEAKLSVLPNGKMKIEGKLVFFDGKAIKLPFVIEGTLSAQPKNVIKFEPTTITLSGVPVKKLMDILGVELANIIKFKDSIGRIELSGNSFLMIIEKFSDQAIIEGQIKAVSTGNKSLIVTF